MNPTPNSPSYRYGDVDDWRQFINDKVNVLCSHKFLPGLGNFTPLLTNGVIAECRQLHNDAIILVHLADIDWPKDTKPKATKPKAEKTRAPRVLRTKLIAISELL